MTVYSLPARVYELSAMLVKRAYTYQELMDNLTRGQKTDYLTETLTAAKELDLILQNGNNLSLNVDSEILNSIATFRRYCNSKVFRNQTDIFYRVTNIMLNLYDDPKAKQYLKYSFTSDGVHEFQEYLSSKTNIGNCAQNMRAWRFWASFLGLGVIHNYSNKFIFLPNMYVNLIDAIDNAKIINGKYTASEFIHIISPYCGEALPDKGNNNLNLALSNAFREANKNEKLIILNELDAKEKWHLHKATSENLGTEFSHIEIKGK